MRLVGERIAHLVVAPTVLSDYSHFHFRVPRPHLQVIFTIMNLARVHVEMQRVVLIHIPFLIHRAANARRERRGLPRPFDVVVRGSLVSQDPDHERALFAVEWPVRVVSVQIEDLKAF